ncbi:hypothetical protein BKG77_16055 [Mycobacteroides chelonae]|uniref:HTH tetR-type domain-containing protein n=1 Tax=Mycobacteroides chelonae TaxID=1774 RepID=A0A1S1MAU0_MYCCH|nr:TetR/AcrR family transcriptional regulator [Mycobacteroides chelonae]OHU24912.1 hypothetical protein BKG77_16055 [Mycobacteroides chelonae]OHU63056.1 hypothetical protein BKG85_16655 [Mycobacteroides chelonae]OHU79045.1 hypothetical protein BKG84_12275 [Mycobacteroides chelonae]QQG89958.1 TetR/AcrR family transcriptional regulator [Mycobacteroides chelonae]QQG94776.1 TetR/AcrR family transcriptional regulator [Mycobacteroides chelonae]
MSTTPRTRLSVAARRDELLRVGSVLFATRPYDEVWIEHVAQEAGVSSALIYHYFGNKKTSVGEIVRRDSESFLRAITVDPVLPPYEQFLTSLDAYLDHIEQHPHAYIAMTRGLASTDPAVREILDSNRAVVTEHTLKRIVSGTPTPAQRMIARAWVVYIVDMCMAWLIDSIVDRAELRDLLIRSYDALSGVITDIGSA